MLVGFAFMDFVSLCSKPILFDVRLNIVCFLFGKIPNIQKQLLNLYIFQILNQVAN